MTPTATVIDDVRHLDCGADAARLADVRLGRTVTLVILSTPDARGERHVRKIVGSVVTVHPDAEPGPNDASASALAVLAASVGQLPQGTTFGLRVWNR